MSRTWYTSMSYARNLVHTFEAMGIDAERVLREVRLARDTLDDTDARLPDTAKASLWERALAQTDDPYFGLHAGAQAAFGRWGLVEFIAMNSRTLEDALENAVRYTRLMADAKQIDLTRAGSEVRYVFSTHELPMPLSRHVLESDAIYTLRLIRHIVSPAFTPSELWFPHALEGEVQVYQRAFAAPVYFRQPAHAMVFDAAWLEQPVALAHHHLRAPLEVEAARMLAKVHAMETFTERVTTVLQFDPARMTLEDVSERLNLGSRTLQRRLKAEGTSFREVQDAVRRQHAVVYLEDSEMPLGEISYRLGYSERSAFYRAVKRWLGMTAQEYRMQNGIV